MINRDEAIRYLGAKSDEGIADILDEAIKKASALSPKHVLAEVAVEKIDDNGILLANGICLFGELAKNSLSGCQRAILLTATLTLDADRLIDTAGSASKEAVINAVLSSAIEGYLDEVERKLIKRFADNGKYLTPRFSPGYADLPLALQANLLAATNAEKLLGVHLTENLMLVPVKSVTAIIGVSDEKKDFEKHRCDVCKKACIYRKL